MSESNPIIENPWQNFIHQCQVCTACPLSKNRTHAVVYRGSVQAPLLIIGDGPREEEDVEGIPLVGETGVVINNLLSALDISETYFHITNIVKCRLEANSIPTIDEARACRTHLNEQFKFVRPQVIMLLGSTAYQFFTGDLDSPFEQIRGQWIKKGPYWIMATIHPNAILQDTSLRAALWQDAKAIRKKMENLGILDQLKI